MNTRRDFLRNLAIGAGTVALDPQSLASAVHPYQKQIIEDKIVQILKDTFVCSKNWFDCSEEELVVRIMTVVHEGLAVRSDGKFDSNKDDFTLVIPHWIVLRKAFPEGLPEYTFEYDLHACYPHCTIKQSPDGRGYAVATWNNLIAYIG